MEFYGKLNWITGLPLVSTIEAYRRTLLTDALYSFDTDGRPRFNFVLCGRAKKNSKTSDLVLAALYRLLVWPSDRGNDCYILANDEGQAKDDLDLVKKLIVANLALERELHVNQKEILRKDGRGSLRILPARDAAGAHGKTYVLWFR
jgi:phage terminase large subunit-like protein